MRVSSWGRLPSLGVLFVLCGCTTFVGQKIDKNGALPQPGGVPFVLTKPEYTLTIAADATEPTKAVHTIAVSYVPDPTQRYTLALDPALLVNGKLDLDFGVHGNITSAVGTTTSRVVDTFASIVKLAQVSALLDSASTLSVYEKELENIPRCKGVREEIDRLGAEAAVEVAGRPHEKRLRADLVGERLHYLDQGQLDCMKELVAKDQTTKSKATYEAALKASKEAAAKAKNAEMSVLNHEIEAAVAALNEDALAKLSKGLTGRPSPFTEVEAAATAGKNFVVFTLAGRFARSLVDMPPEVWRARHLAYLERRITKCRFDIEVLKGDPSCGEAGVKDGLEKLRTEWSRTLGEPALVARVAEMDRLLKGVEKSNRFDQGRHSMVEEHVKLRDERDKLQARIDQLRSDVIGKNKVVSLGPDVKKPSKVEARTNVAVTLVKQAYVDAVNGNPNTKYKDLKEFVLVLTPDDSGAVLPLPVPEPQPAAEGAKK